MQTKDTVRVILLNSAGQALMFKVGGGDLSDPNKPLRRAFWITPGGRIEGNETPEQAVTREVWEETGIANVPAGEMFGYGEQVLEWKGVPTLLRERFYCVKVPISAVTSDHLTDDEKANFQEHRWWSVAEMRASGEIFLPQCLPQLVEELLTGTVNSVRTIDLSTPSS